MKLSTTLWIFLQSSKIFPAMRVLFLDTETNGLPKNSYALPSNIGNWPRVLQIAWQLWELVGGSFTKLSEVSFLIQPDPEMIWDAGAEKIHKLSRDRLCAEGLPGARVFGEFRAILEHAHVVVAHNIAFDRPVILAECLRAFGGSDWKWWWQIEYCTCENTKSICKLPSKRPSAADPYKRPRLQELYEFLHGVGATFDFHNAVADTECLVQCFQKLLERRLVPVEDLERRLRVLGRL